MSSWSAAASSDTKSTGGTIVKTPANGGCAIWRSREEISEIAACASPKSWWRLQSRESGRSRESRQSVPGCLAWSGEEGLSLLPPLAPNCSFGLVVSYSKSSSSRYDAACACVAPCGVAFFWLAPDCPGDSFAASPFVVSLDHLLSLRFVRSLACDPAIIDRGHTGLAGRAALEAPKFRIASVQCQE